MVFLSDCFDSTNGVKQSEILLPFFLNVFIDDLLAKLAKLKVCCYVGHYFYGCTAYADNNAASSALAQLVTYHTRLLFAFC